MSVGGVVTGIDKIPGNNRLRIRTREDTHPGDIEVCVEVDRNEETEQIRIGDGFWWQGEICFWTPRYYNLRPWCKADNQIPKKSGSYSYPCKNLEAQKNCVEAHSWDDGGY